MKYYLASSFERQFKKLDSQRKAYVRKAIAGLVNFFDLNQKPEGLGLKHLRQDYWEIRFTLKDRILFSFENDIITFIAVGNHDEIRRHLKNV